jgi:tRNA (cmo5U34)-methyltransferase
MSLTATADMQPVHYPADPDQFKFDAEVSAIFGNMASRSIPNFIQSHSAHARMLNGWIKPGVSICDIGASRGHFLAAVKRLYPFAFQPSYGSIAAVDNSPDMCRYLREDYPSVTVIEIDVNSPAFDLGVESYDIICVNYVLQFIRPEQQIAALLKIIKAVKPGGVLLWGHKSSHYGPGGEAAHEQYILWRMEQGYTRDEIEAKTRALRGSMFPMDHRTLLDTLRFHGFNVQETFRYMMFCNFFAVKS